MCVCVCKSVNVNVTARRVSGVYTELGLEVVVRCLVVSCPVWVLGA